MKKYLKSIITALICFVIVIILNFLLPRMLPGDPIAYLSGLDESGMSEDTYNYYYDALHLGETPLVQFEFYLKSIFDGSLGYSYKQNAIVSDLIGEKLKYTFQITIPAWLLAGILGLSLGMGCGLQKGSKQDRIVSAANVIVNALPGFAIALILIIVFAFNIEIFPYSGLNSVGIKSGTFTYFLDRIYHLILPVICLVIAEFPSRFMLTRNMAATLADEKYILYAKQRGLSLRTVKFKYLFPNMAGPFISMMGISFSSCVGGSLIVENLFSINGMGSLLMSAVHSLDYPLIQGILFVCTFVMVIAIVFTDIFSILINPRIRLGKGTM